MCDRNFDERSRQAEEAQISTKTLYAAKDSLGIREYEEQNRKWWELA